MSSRDLAKSLKMSHGNLEYHFPNKESILLAIYDQMKSEMSRYYIGDEKDLLNPLGHFHRLLVRLDQFQSEYRFFCDDIVEICRRYKKVNRDLERNMRIRKTQMANFFSRFVALKLMQAEPHEGYYESLQHTIRILLTFWQPQKIVITNFNYTNQGDMVFHIWDLLTPHFTKRGLRAYRKIISET